MLNRFLSPILKKSGFVLSIVVLASSFAAAQQRARYDVTNYRIDAQILPFDSRLATTADVTFTPLEPARTFVFELNGSLKVESVSRIAGGAALPTPTVAGRNPRQPTARPTAPTQTATSGSVTFVQDQIGISDVGPNVRVDLGDSAVAGTPITLRFKYSGTLTTAEGGPLTTKKLASVDEKVSYLMYAARWFPFHDYAADRATAEINVTVPDGVQVVGYSDEPVAKTGGKYRFVYTKPALIGNLAAGKFSSQTLRFGKTELQFYTQSGNEARVKEYGETLGKALEFYNQRFGAADYNGRYVVAQIDDDSLDAYSGLGTLFLSTRFFNNQPVNADERLQREAAYQWWGQTVGLKSFDEVWLSQGLAEYSALEFRESGADGATIESLNRELLERALTFEQTASIIRAPGVHDDQSAAYQSIIFYKGAAVFRLLRETMGAAKFNQLLKSYLTQYRGKNPSIDEFEKLASNANGDNLRYFFARWVEGTGVPEFKADYQILRTRAGKFIARGTVRQSYDNLRLPVDVKLRAEGDGNTKTQTLRIEDTSDDFNLESTGKPLEVVVDPNYKLLRIDDDLRVSSIARRGIEQFKEGNYAEAQQQFEAALKLDRSNSWVYYHLGLLFLEQRNYDLAISNFQAARDGNKRPTWIETWANIKMGNAYDSKGDRTRAQAAYKQAINLGDNYDNAQEIAQKYLVTAYDPRSKDVTASR